MSSETLDIKVDDNGTTATVTNNLVKLGGAAENVAVATDKATASVAKNTTANTGNSDAVTKAERSVRGYTDAQGNYIRVVTQANGAVSQGQSAQAALTSALSANSIETGRAAAGYGALNSATSSSATASAAFNASVRGLNTELGTYEARSGSAAASTKGAADANNAAGEAGKRAADGMRSAADAHDRAGSAAGGNGARVQSARSTYGAFNETILDTIRRLGLLAVAFVSIQAARFGSEQINARNSIANLGLSTAETTALLERLNNVQATTGVSVTALAQGYRIGLGQMQALQQQGGTLVTTMAQLARLAQQNGADLTSYGTVANTLFGTFKGGVSTMATYNAIQQQTRGFSSALLNAFQQQFSVMGSGTAVNAAFFNALASGNITMVQFAQLVDRASQAMNGNKEVGITLEAAYNQLTGSLKTYVGSSSEGLSVTNLLAAAMMELAQHPGAVVAGLTAIGAAIAVIGLGAFIAALGVLGTALAGIGATIASVATLFGTISGVTAAAIAAVASLTNFIYQNNDAYQQNAEKLGDASKFTAIFAQALVDGINWVGSMAKTCYEFVTSLSFVKTALDYVKTALGGVAETAQGWIDSFKESAANFTKALDEMNKKVQDFQASSNTMGKPIASFTQLAKDGSRAAIEFAPPTDAAAASLSKVGSSAIGAAGGLSSYTGAVGNAAAATGTFANAADRLASQIAGTQAGVGEFTQQTINATASMSNLEKTSNGTVGALNSVGEAFRKAGNDAEFFAINSRSANTVSGQIGNGGSGAVGGTVTGDPISRFSAASMSSQVTGYGVAGGFITTTMHPAGSDYGKYSPEAQTAYGNAIAAGLGSAAAEAAMNAVQQKQTDAYLTQQHLKDPVVQSNTSAISANTNALTANTAANQNLPDLINGLNTTTTTSGFDANGHAGVGATVTQVTTQNGPAIPVQAPEGGFGPSWDVQAIQNGGFAKGPTEDPSQLRPISNPIINMTIKSDDFGQFKQSQRQIAMDIGTRVAMAAA